MKSSSQRRSAIDLRRNNCFKRHVGEPYLPEVRSYRIRQTQADCNFSEESIEYVLFSLLPSFRLNTGAM